MFGRLGIFLLRLFLFWLVFLEVWLVDGVKLFCKEDGGYVGFWYEIIIEVLGLVLMLDVVRLLVDEDMGEEG